ncbi:hypothetical protein DMENIID0001_059940 [Sergentomyia squamirostris]
MRIDASIDSPNGLYFAGDRISGSVVVMVDQPQQLKTITVFLRGVAKIAFREGIAIPFFFPSNNIYFDQHTVINRELVVFANGSQPPVVAKGDYTFSFAFLLPNSLVSSFTSAHGHVTYWLEVVVRKRFFTQRIRRNLEIYEFNENTPQISYRPLPYETILKPVFSCILPGLFQGRHATARCHIRIPRTTFYSGEIIEITVSLMDYHGEDRIATIVTDLLQEFSFQGGMHNHRLVEPLLVVASQRSRSMRVTHMLQVPLLPRSGNIYRRASVSYFLRVRVNMLCRKYHLTVPVILTGPLNDFSRKWKSQYTHTSVSSETGVESAVDPATDTAVAAIETAPQPQLRVQNQQREHANELLRFLVERRQAEVGEIAGESIEEIEEDSPEAERAELQRRPDMFATIIEPSPPQGKHLPEHQ